MTKSMVTKIFIGSLIAVVAGVFVVAVGFIAALSTGTLVMEGPDVTGFELSSTAPAAIGVALLGVLGIVAGGSGSSSPGSARSSTPRDSTTRPGSSSCWCLAS